MRFDSALGNERLLAIFCPQPFHLSTFREQLRMAGSDLQNQLPPLVARLRPARGAAGQTGTVAAVRKQFQSQLHWGPALRVAALVFAAAVGPQRLAAQPQSAPHQERYAVVIGSNMGQARRRTAGLC